MLVDTVVRHWISLVVGGAGGKDGCGREMIHHTAFLYVDDALVASTDLVWLYGAFDTLTGLSAGWGYRKF